MTEKSISVSDVRRIYDRVSMFFEKPKNLAHSALVFFLIAFIIQFYGSIYLYSTIYAISFLLGTASLFVNGRSDKQKRLGIVGFIEVGLSILPMILLLILIIFFKWQKNL